jgi:hypothetical protein
MYAGPILVLLLAPLGLQRLGDGVLAQGHGLVEHKRPSPEVRVLVDDEVPEALELEVVPAAGGPGPVVIEASTRQPAGEKGGCVVIVGISASSSSYLSGLPPTPC